jgi:hypothetical protein
MEKRGLRTQKKKSFQEGGKKKVIGFLIVTTIEHVRQATFAEEAFCMYPVPLCEYVRDPVDNACAEAHGRKTLCVYAVFLCDDTEG